MSSTSTTRSYLTTFPVCGSNQWTKGHWEPFDETLFEKAKRDGSLPKPDYGELAETFGWPEVEENDELRSIAEEHAEYVKKWQWQQMAKAILPEPDNI
ncbi:hypothetical protein PG994_006797 [Apiospora phragmitis]|uniref:Uncharacterized protein n=1 Tax=Apiospora phragmitis TaxID=2905665 RepID=A0ABR1VG31_9PEZI